MVFYKEKRWYFWINLVFLFFSIFAKESIPTISFIISSIIFYVYGYLKNIKYVLDDFSIKSFDFRGKLLKDDNLKDGYSIKRVYRGNGKYARVWVELRVNGNLYDFRWNKKIVKRLGNYINVSKILKENTKDNFLGIIIALIFIFSLFISIFLMAYGLI